LTIQRARVEVSDINISSTIEHGHLRNAVTWITLTISPLAVNLNIARQIISAEENEEILLKCTAAATLQLLGIQTQIY